MESNSAGTANSQNVQQDQKGPANPIKTEEKRDTGDDAFMGGADDPDDPDDPIRAKMNDMKAQAQPSTQTQPATNAQPSTKPGSTRSTSPSVYTDLPSAAEQLKKNQQGSHGFYVVWRTQFHKREKIDVPVTVYEILSRGHWYWLSPFTGNDAGKWKIIDNENVINPAGKDQTTDLASKLKGGKPVEYVGIQAVAWYTPSALLNNKDYVDMLTTSLHFIKPLSKEQKKTFVRDYPGKTMQHPSLILNQVKWVDDGEERLTWEIKTTVNSIDREKANASYNTAARAFMAHAKQLKLELPADMMRELTPGQDIPRPLRAPSLDRRASSPPRGSTEWSVEEADIFPRHTTPSSSVPRSMGSGIIPPMNGVRPAKEVHFGEEHPWGQTPTIINGGDSQLDILAEIRKLTKQVDMIGVGLEEVKVELTAQKNMPARGSA
ncbi:hypothetical protein LEL_10567 [Akanthomyces lecanii RCEF 1005]|uniref:Uncharacterized protein n=1 Tax=Akanthomyces lecanii RCEF 1005 TaxID=1081108 RepID=A0A162MQ37_CORDF|nr:hypothetical protein LEL_10567 [Akanthomyces lecanii RCEF 1005]